MQLETKAKQYIHVVIQPDKYNMVERDDGVRSSHDLHPLVLLHFETWHC